MGKLRRSGKFAKACLYLALAKLALAVIPLGESDWAGEPMVSKWGVVQVVIGLAFIGLTLIPFYNRTLVPDRRRIRTRRHLGAACILDGLSRVIMDLWPTALYPLLMGIGMVISICFVITITLEYSSDDDDKPRRKRKRIKAKWPSWIPKRWSPAPPIPSPRPAQITRAALDT